ncbi:MAG: ankyrin repeat domain-containing protein [Spirochaetaceae bacterium]|nr:ankyrin repeat domain-containing protein [Spirochaetaceae bacterium]
MKKLLFYILSLFFFHIETICASEYKWDLINALLQNDSERIENIISSNIMTMTALDKRLVMNFAINYSSGENTLMVLELLLKHNIYPNSFDLFTAINRNRRNSVIQFILRNGVIPNGEILLLTMARQRFDLARQFIEMGVDVNFQYSLLRQDADGMTSLLYASKWGNLEMVKLLVENGANINIQAVNGDTVLSIARRNNNNAILNYLLAHGATEFFNNAPKENIGIVNMLDNQIFNFQIGSYRLSGGNRVIRFTGNKSSGNIILMDSINNRVINGVYRIAGNNMTITLEGFTFNYRLDSNESFSGNGEVWIRVGN